MSEFGKIGLQIIEQEGLIENDFAYSTVSKYFKKVADNIKIGEALGSRETDAFENDKGWYTKAAKGFVADAIENIKPQLNAIFEKIESGKAKYLPTYLLYQQLVPHLYHLSLLSEIKIEFDKQLRENNRVHISEFNHKILEIITKEPVPFIYERLGEKYNHILIDEFQDTSKLQVQNLLPLIDNSLSYENFNLAVGDSKQAIYRFRGGDMDTIIALYNQDIESMAKTYGGSELTLERLENVRGHLEKDNLTTNRRSAKEIIEFNNTFFAQTAQLYQDTPLASLVYDADFQQLVPDNAKIGGSVNIEFVESEEGDSEESDVPLMVSRTLEIVAEMIQNGYSQKDISILCRQKYHAKSIANALKEANYGVISEDSLSLSFSAAINLLTTFMKVLIKPDNKLAKYEALYLVYKLILKKVPENQDNVTFKIAAEANDVRVFYEFVNQKLNNSEPTTHDPQIKTQDSRLKSGTPPAQNSLAPFKLLQLGVYELAEKLIITFGLFELIPERDYLFRFLDVVIEFSNRKGSHLSDFLDYWETQKNKISISAPSDPIAITVQTIHKSKGLEYPVVIVPYADWQFTPKSTRDKIWINLVQSNELSIGMGEKSPSSDEEPISKSGWLQSGSVLMKPDLLKTPKYVEEQYVEECSKMLVENMNLLYVALTRPTERLFILANQADFLKENNKNKVSYWLNQFSESTVDSPESKMLSPLSKVKIDIAGSVLLTTHYPLLTTNFATVISSDRSRDMRLRRQADRLFDVDTFEQKKDHGNKIHYALSLIETKNDIEKAMLTMQSEGLIDASEVKNMQNSIENLIQNPALSYLFDEKNEVLNEREILTPNGSMHRPDRVVKTKKEVIIIDYKTGNQADSHKKQLKKYMSLYQEMGFENISGKLIYIQSDDFEVVEM